MSIIAFREILWLTSQTSKIKMIIKRSKFFIFDQVRLGFEMSFWILILQSI